MALIVFLPTVVPGLSRSFNETGTHNKCCQDGELEGTFVSSFLLLSANLEVLSSAHFWFIAIVTKNPAKKPGKLWINYNPVFDLLGGIVREALEVYYVRYHVKYHINIMGFI